MNRWMTRLAFGAKCGRLGVSGLDAGTAAARPGTAPVSSEARAILPTPTPHSRKKWRRVTARAGETGAIGLPSAGDGRLQEGTGVAGGRADTIVIAFCGALYKGAGPDTRTA